jgi:hypothetical protein
LHLHNLGQFTHCGLRGNAQIRNRLTIDASLAYHFGPGPPELLLAALSASAGQDAAEYLSARSLPRNRTARAFVCGGGRMPVRPTSFPVVVDMPDLDDRSLVRSVRACRIHNTLSEPSEEIAVAGVTAGATE